MGVTRRDRQFETAWRLHTFLTARGIPYAIIGGIAVQRWGYARRWLADLARVADDPDVLARFERVWARRDRRD